MADTELNTLGSVIKVAYEGENNTNAYTDAEVTLVASAAQDADLVKYISATTDATASYELVIGNAGGIHEMTSGSANEVVIPANAAVAFPVNTRIDLIQTGAGLTTVTITSDTLTGDAVSTGQNKAMSLWKKSATVWHIIGGTTA